MSIYWKWLRIMNKLPDYTYFLSSTNKFILDVPGPKT